MVVVFEESDPLLGVGSTTRRGQQVAQRTRLRSWRLQSDAAFRFRPAVSSSIHRGAAPLNWPAEKNERSARIIIVLLE